MVGDVYSAAKAQAASAGGAYTGDDDIIDSQVGDCEHRIAVVHGRVLVLGSPAGWSKCPALSCTDPA